MLVAGAGGHAKEVLGIFREQSYTGIIKCFDDQTTAIQLHAVNQFYPILKNLEEAKQFFKTTPGFVLGVGNPKVRKILSDKLTGVGGQLCSIISPFAHIGMDLSKIGIGANIMTGAVITQNISIGIGVLIHIHASVHHDVCIGEYSEIAPGSRILGGALIGSFVSIGAGAVILPKIKVGDFSIIGAGAVVTKNVDQGTIVAGVPAKPIKSVDHEQQYE